MRGTSLTSSLEARVPSERWESLRAAYGTRASRLPPEILESMLVQDATHPEIWRILTLWRSHAALNGMRASGTTPTGILIFRDAGAEPILSMGTVWANPQAVQERSR